MAHVARLLERRLRDRSERPESEELSEAEA